MTQPRRTPGRGGPSRRGRGTGSPRATRGAATRTSLGRAGSNRATPLRSADRVRAVPTRSAATDPARSASRPASARRAAAGGAARRTRAPQPHRLTGRATVLALVLGALLLAYAYPVRIYLNQQAQISTLEANQAAQRRRIGELTDESQRWKDPTYIRTQARERLQMAMPGDTVFMVSRPGSTASTSTDPNAGKAKNTGPWYGQLWSSVQAADKPRTAP
ncbi:FtsB family cell division protein [Rugosimonospora africana]|uniref:Cell division protein FtsB n=1 Tax=Rugosimonospora africana TaxID=556532 RepID=A0A8J3QL65_9ACTN|nr:septum formation initiator family protein [Rugosimonospora africana]GIH12107.1 hypothetical protein Raf01_02790 [Rugosimonospora africana]